MKRGKLLQIVAQFIIVLVMTYAAILGTWLGGADPGVWTFVLGAWFSALLVTGINLFGAKK